MLSYRKPWSREISVATVATMTICETTVEFLSLVRIHARSNNAPATFDVPSFRVFRLVPRFSFEVVNRPLELGLLFWARDLSIRETLLHNQGSKFIFNVGIWFEAPFSQFHQEASTQQFP